MAYLPDANTFIEAKNTYYGMDFCAAFWDWLRQANADGRVFSIERVRNELTDGNDALSSWASEQGPTFFLPPDEAILPALTSVSAWATSRTYPPAAVNTFLQAADYYLVAQALAHDHVVVTREVAGATRRIKIPNASIGVGVQCMTPFELLRVERARFVLGQA